MEIQIPDKCPRCGLATIKRKGPYGEFYGCTGYPKCRWTKSTNTCWYYDEDDFFEGEDLYAMAGRSPELIFDNYQKIRHMPGAQEAYNRAAGRIRKNESKYD